MENSYFEFDQEYYLQKQGTAIGKMAPSYAILFMDAIESAFLDSMEEKPSICWRYIISWYGNMAKKLLQISLKSWMPFIQRSNLPREWSNKNVNFLDVSVTKKEDGTHLTDLYTKPTDTHQYLHSTSCHPFYCKKSIPYSQTLRLSRICSDRGKLDERCKELEMWLCERAMVRDQISAAKIFSRDELLDKTKGSKPYRASLNHCIPSGLKRHSENPGKYSFAAHTRQKSQGCLPRDPIGGFRNAKSLKDYLVRAKLPKENIYLGCFHCKKSNCVTY